MRIGPKKNEETRPQWSGFCSCGGRIRTCDLQVMSLASYQLLHSAMFSRFAGAKVILLFHTTKKTRIIFLSTRKKHEKQTIRSKEKGGNASCNSRASAFHHIIIYISQTENNVKKGKNIVRKIAVRLKSITFAPANGQVSYGQLPLNPPGRERSKGIRL